MGDIYQALANQSLTLEYYYNGLQAATIRIIRVASAEIYLRLTKYHLAAGIKIQRCTMPLKPADDTITGIDCRYRNNLGIGYQYVYLKL